jgi:nucleoside-diphosphate-sugar epimerase
VRVLVTGSAGFIGAAVVAELAGRGIEPIGYDRPDDIRDRVALDRAMAGVEGVINLAGTLGTAELIGAEARAIEVNILGADAVYSAAAAHGIPTVQIGTGHRGQLNPYAITKACAEDLALSRACWGGQPIAVVRAYHVYGPGQKPAPPHGTSLVRKIVPSFVCRALTGMDVEVNGSGSQRIDLVHVADVAVALVDALGGPYGLVLEAGTGVATTVLEAAKTVVEVCGSRSSIVHLPMRPGEPTDAWVVAVAPVASCRRQLWPLGLAETVEYYRRLVGV